MPTRVSTSQMFQGGQSHIANARDKEVRSADRSSSLKELSRPSDDPGEWVKVADLKNDLSVQQSLAKNAASANHVLSATENLLSDLQGFANRAHEIAIASSSTTGSGEKAREAYLSEAKVLFDSTMRTLNTRYAGRTLLAGFKSEGPAFTPQGDFVGDKNEFKLEIDRNLKVPLNISTTQNILGEGLRNGVDIPATFKNLIEGLENDDVDRVRVSLDGFMQTIDQLSIARSHIGARMNQIQQTIDSHGEQQIQQLDAISKFEEADPIKAFSDLARDQTVLKAAISTTDKVLHDNALDILYK